MGWVWARSACPYLVVLIFAVLISGCVGPRAPIAPGPPAGVPETGVPEPKITFETNFTVKDQLGREVVALPNAYSGEPYSRTITPLGGTPPYRCALASGSSLPGTIQFVDCTIMGIAPTIPMTSTSRSFPFSFTITDSKGTVGGPFELTIVVRHRPPALTLPANIGPAIIGKPFEHSFCDTPSDSLDCKASPSTISGGVPSYTFSASGLPVGLTMEPNGLLRGTIPEAYSGLEQREFEVCVKDSALFQTCEKIVLLVTPFESVPVPTATPPPTTTPPPGKCTSPYDGTWSGSLTGVLYKEHVTPRQRVDLSFDLTLTMSCLAKYGDPGYYLDPGDVFLEIPMASSSYAALGCVGGCATDSTSLPGQGYPSTVILGPPGSTGIMFIGFQNGVSLTLKYEISGDGRQIRSISGELLSWNFGHESGCPELTGRCTPTTGSFVFTKQ